MGFFSKIIRSADLAKGMADRLGVDMAEAFTRNGEAAAYGYRGAVMRCSSCTQQDACAVLQAANEHLDHAPGYCRNKADFEHFNRYLNA